MLLSLISLTGISYSAPPADLIITGGTIYTLEAEQPQVEAVVIYQGTIVFAGKASEALRYRDASTKLLEVSGGCVLPGLIDSHAHLISLGRSLSELDLTGTSSALQIRELVLKKQSQTKPGVWISGRGWDQNDWEKVGFPSWQDLRGSEANPVYLRRVDGHAVWINQTALKLCDISSKTPDAEGGKIICDESGNPTGVFIDNAINLIEMHLPVPSQDELSGWAKTAMTECNRFGLVGVHDAGVDSAKLTIYEKLLKDHKLTLRVNAILSVDDEEFLEEQYKLGVRVDPQGYLTIRSIKLYADGALGSRGAFLLEPYSDDPGNRGLMVTPPEQLQLMTETAIKHGFQVCTHAIGDAANHQVLDVYEKAQSAYPGQDLRLRIEHCQVVAPEDMARFKTLGIIPAMQPIHATSDMSWAEKRLGSRRIRGAYAWRSLLDRGNRIACGSDFPVESPNPLLGIYAAVTRQDLQGNPKGGWYPEERMTLDQAIRGYTLDAAQAEFAEQRRGSIKVGKLADFTILDQDVFKVASTQIPSIEVLYTFVGGKIVFSKSAARSGH